MRAVAFRRRMTSRKPWPPWLWQFAVQIWKRRQCQGRPREWKPDPEIWTSTSPLAYSAQRGVIASLALANEQQLVVHWHAVDELGVGDAGISATVGGQVVAADDIEQSSKYPDRSSVVLLIDASGAGRETPLRQEKALLVQVATRAQERHHVDVAVYADAVQLLQPRDTSAAILNSLVDPLTVHDAPAYLGHALAAIIQLPPLFGVERRAIFVFTDGHADDAINAEKLIKSAAEHETSINFVLSRSDRSVNPSLTEIARATGGIVVNEANRSSFLELPFALLDSWATARFPMRLHPLVLGLAPEVQAILHRNSGDVRVSASIPLPPQPRDRPPVISSMLIPWRLPAPVLQSRWRQPACFLSVAGTRRCSDGQGAASACFPGGFGERQKVSSPGQNADTMKRTM